MDTSIACFGRCGKSNTPRVLELVAERAAALGIADVVIPSVTGASGLLARDIAQTLKRFGEGTKVAVEISLAASDAGLISPHSEVISCGGSGRGLDTALVLRPAHAQDFFDLEILEIICKPRSAR